MWTKQDWLCTGAAALSAFGLTLAGFQPIKATAGNDPAAAVAVAAPKLTIGDVGIGARLIKDDGKSESSETSATIRPGPIPKMILRATNSGSASESVKFTAFVTTTSMRDRMSRVVMPKKSPPAWTQDFEIALKAGESQTFEIDTNLQLAMLSQATLVLQAAKQQVYPLSISAISESPKSPTTRSTQQATR